jgi:hypothetical protein
MKPWKIKPGTNHGEDGIAYHRRGAAMRALKGASAILVGTLTLIFLLIFLPAVYLAGLLWVSENVHEYLDLAATIALAICLFVFLPCALFHVTRKFSAYGLYISSVIFGAFTWILGFLVTFQYWGSIGVFVGVILGLVGIVALGILASAFHRDWSTAGMLTTGLLLTFGARAIVMMLAKKYRPSGAGDSATGGGRSAPTGSRD